MADKNSTIKIDIEGVEKFLKTVEGVEKELLNIETLLKSKGFKGNPEKLRESAIIYRKEMLAANHAVEKSQLDTVKKVSQAQSVATKIATRLTIGRGVAEFAQNILRGLGDIIEKNKDTDASIGKLDKAIGNLKSSLASLGLGFLKLVAVPIVGFINIMEKVTTALTGYNFEQARTLALLNEQNVAFNEQTNAIIAGSQALDARSESLKKLNETSGVASKLSLTASIEELKSFQELVNLQNKFNNATGDRTALGEQVNRKSAEHAQLIKRINNDLLNISKKELETKKELGTLTEDETRKLDGILKNEEKRTEQLQKQLELRQKFFDTVKQDVGFLQDASADVAEQINLAISEDRLADVQQLLKDFDLITKEISKSTDVLKQDSKDVLEITNEILKLNGELADIQERKDSNPLGGIDEAITAERANLKKYKDDFESVSDVISNSIQDSTAELFDKLSVLAGDTSSSQDFANAIEDAFLVTNPISFGFSEDEFLETIKKMGEAFKKIAEENGVILEDDLNKTLKSFAKDSPLLNDLNKSIARTTNEINALNKAKTDDAKQSEEDVKRLLELEKQITENTQKRGTLQKKIDEAGIGATDVLNKREEERKKIVEELEKKRLFNQKEAEAREIAALQKIKESTPETFDLIDEFLLKTKQNSVENLTLIQNIVDAVKKAQGELKEGEGLVTFNQQTGVSATDGARQNQGANTQIQVAETLFTQLLALRKKQEEELLNLDITSSDERIEVFKKEFKLKERELNVDLKQTENAIEVAQENLSDTQEEFTLRQQKERRQANQDEIDIVNDQVDSLLRLEVERYQKEQFLRVGAYLVKLDELKKQGFDTTLLEREFLQQELDLNIKHRKNLKGISDNYNELDEEARDARNKKIIADAVSIGQSLASEFMNLANAFSNLQDAIAQKAIDSLNEQISNLDEKISETTSNIDSLESDLEGKRSGRREALLRGIEIEKEREASLVRKKIELQEELERVEKEQSERRKASAIAQATMNFALALTNVWANSTIPYPAQAVFGGIMSGILSGIYIAEIATIENQQFGDGGLIDFGQSHANGGVPAVVDGRTPVEIERGESIINAKSTSMYRPLLSAINKAGGGVEFARGGVAAEANFDMMSNALSPSTVKQLAAMSNQPVYVSVTDINNMQKRSAQVTDIATL